MTIHQLPQTDDPSVPEDRAPFADWYDLAGDSESSGPSDTPASFRPAPDDGWPAADETPTLIMDGPRPAAADTTPVPTGTIPSATAPAADETPAQGASVLKTTATAAWTGATYLGHGLRHSVTNGARHVLALDHQEAHGGVIKNEAQLALLKNIRKDRARVLRNTAIAVAAATVVGMEFVGWALPAVEAGAAVLGLGALGRRRIAATRPAPAMPHAVPFTPPLHGQPAAPANRPFFPPQFGRPLPPTQQAAPGADQNSPQAATPTTQALAIDDDGTPFPLAHCVTPEQAAEGLRRALTAERLATQAITVVARYPWGWEFAVHLKGVTPAEVGERLDKLEAHLELPAGGFMPEPDPKNRSKLTARLAFDDPFAGMPKPTGHAPNSLDVRDRVGLGRMMDGSDFAIALNGARSLVIGVSGSAKSTGALRCLVEAITASHNGIVIEMDPVKDGLREFEGVMAAPPIRGGNDCVEWLGYMATLAEARNKMRHRLDMGDSWVPSAEHPAIFVLVDEYIYLPPEGKELAIALLRLGRQSGVFPVFAAQDGTSDSMGRAIADSFTLRIMLAARHADIPVVFGTGAIADGYRPDRLTPAQNDQERCDAGRFYVKGGGYNRPLKGAFNEYTYTHIKQLVAERAAAGRPGFDLDSLTQAGLLHLTRIPGVAIGTRGSSSPSSALADRIDRLATEHGLTDGPVIATLLRLYDAKGATFIASSTIVEQLAAEGITWAGVEVDGDRLGRILRAHNPGASVSRPTVDGRQVRGWHLEDVTRAAEGLMDPSSARQRAA